MVIENFITAKEIMQQPELWGKTYEVIASQKEEISSFLMSLRKEKTLEVILTGAGSSCFVGEAVAGKMQQNLAMPVRTVATTDLVTHPEMYISKLRPVLLISFARSGNSPESVASVNLANQIGGQVFHLIITCNVEGELAQLKGQNNVQVIVLPPEANDKGLAMTGSVTSMMLSALLVSRINQIESLKEQVNLASEYGKLVLNKFDKEIEKMANLGFERIVCLGSGPFQGLAREAHLKVQELSDGKTIGKFDSFLGFRHGPRAVVNDKTLIVYFLSNLPYALQYELDMVNAISKEQRTAGTIAITEKMQNIEVDLQITLNDSAKLDEEFLVLPYLIPAQLVGLYNSIKFGLNPDTPSENGVIHRVVQGVTIYDY